MDTMQTEVTRYSMEVFLLRCFKSNIVCVSVTVSHCLSLCDCYYNDMLLLNSHCCADWAKQSPKVMQRNKTWTEVEPVTYMSVRPASTARPWRVYYLHLSLISHQTCQFYSRVLVFFLQNSAWIKNFTCHEL